MPRIGEFYGITIYMYYADHNPPHLHAIYGSHEAEVDLLTGRIRDGHLPDRAKRMVREWMKAYRAELLDNWNRARQGQALVSLPPIE